MWAGGVAVAVIVPHFHMKKSRAEIVDGVEEAHEQGRRRRGSGYLLRVLEG